MLWQYDVEREKRFNPNPYPSKNDIAYMYIPRSQHEFDMVVFMLGKLCK